MSEEKKDCYIIPIDLVVNSEGSSGGGETNIPGAPKDTAEKNKAQRKASENAKSDKNVAKAIVSNMAKKTVNLALSNYGNITGDYTTGQNISAAISEGMALYSAVKLGPIGIAAYVVDKGVQAFNYVAEIKRSQRESEFKSQRVYATTHRA